MKRAYVDQKEDGEEITFMVDGWPPVKNLAKSMLAAEHQHAQRVLALLRAARDAVDGLPQPVFTTRPVGLELILEAPSIPPGDATNYLGGIGDVLEAKGHRAVLDHLGDLATVALYENDRQIQEVRYRFERGPSVRYIVRVWPLGAYQ
jgi:hypothetical protein